MFNMLCFKNRCFRSLLQCVSEVCSLSVHAGCHGEKHWKEGVHPVSCKRQMVSVTAYETATGDCNPNILDQRLAGSLVPFLQQSISFEEERKIGSFIKENVFGGFLVFFLSKVFFLCEYFCIEIKSPMFVCLFVLKLWIANTFPLPFFICKYLHVFSGNRSPPLWATFTTWLLCPLPRTSVMSYNMPAGQGLEGWRWVSQRMFGVQGRLAT